MPSKDSRRKMKNHMKKRIQPSVIFDVLYGFVKLTPWEQEILNSPYFQRLRWIKQLGFSSYIFPGAEHTRFAHAIGVMHSMHQMIQNLGIAVPDHELMNPKITHASALLHKSLRVAALLHDVGTFPFSHAIEYAYIRHGKATVTPGLKKGLPNSHEHLGSFIIKNTRFEGGITKILEDANLDVQTVSKIIKGESKHQIANQLMHSDLDADRMDYLNRDSYFTGVKYGQFDREYLMANLEPYSLGGGQMGFGVQENALHALEDFLLARFSWYSQVIKHPGSAKFDIMASHVTDEFLGSDLFFQFEDLLDLVENRDERFFWWNDVYFLTRCQEALYHGQIKDRRARELTESLLFRKPVKTLNHPNLSHRIIRKGERQQALQQLNAHVRQMQAALKKAGDARAWTLVDVPEKDVVILSARDAVPIVDRAGKAHSIDAYPSSLTTHVSELTQLVPNLYANDRGYAILKARGLTR